MNNPYGFQRDRFERYRAMEANAGTVFFVLLAMAIATWVFYQPGLLFVLGCLGTGVAIFLSWLKAMEEKMGLSLALAVAGILCGVLLLESDVGRMALLLISLSHFGLSLYGLIAVRKLLRARRS